MYWLRGGLPPAWEPEGGKAVRVSFKVAERREIWWGQEGGSVGKTLAANGQNSGDGLSLNFQSLDKAGSVVPVCGSSIAKARWEKP